MTRLFGEVVESTSSPTISYSPRNHNKEVCPNCGDLVSQLVEFTGFCRPCTLLTKKKIELFLEQHADHIEHYISQGYSVAASIKLVRVELRPTCLACGGVIKRAPANSVFCRTNASCRRYSRRYVYLYRDKGYSKAQALAIVVEELT